MSLKTTTGYTPDNTANVVGSFGSSPDELVTRNQVRLFIDAISATQRIQVRGTDQLIVSILWRNIKRMKSVCFGLVVRSSFFLSLSRALSFSLRLSLYYRHLFTSMDALFLLDYHPPVVSFVAFLHYRAPFCFQAIVHQLSFPVQMIIPVLSDIGCLLWLFFWHLIRLWRIFRPFFFFFSGCGFFNTQGINMSWSSPSLYPRRDFSCSMPNNKSKLHRQF